MRHFRRFLTIAFISVALSNSAQIHELDYRVLSRVDPASHVWDMSAVERLDLSDAVYCFFGDSLLCECVDGETMWYTLHGDTASWLRWEDRLSVADPDSVVPVSGWEISTVPQSCRYTARGKYCRKLHIAEHGEMRTAATVPGMIVTAFGDSAAALMTAETRLFKSSLSAAYISDDAFETCDTLPVRTETRYRWFIPPRAVPVAVMTESRFTDLNGTETSAGSVYTVAPEEMPEAAAADPSQVEAVRSGDSMVFSIPQLASPVRMDVAVTTLSGLPALSATATVYPGMPVSVGIGHLPKGHYILAVGIAGNTHKSYLDL